MESHLSVSSVSDSHGQRKKRKVRAEGTCQISLENGPCFSTEFLLIEILTMYLGLDSRIQSDDPLSLIIK